MHKWKGKRTIEKNVKWLQTNLLIETIKRVTIMKSLMESEDVIRNRIKNWLRLTPSRDKYIKG